MSFEKTGREGLGNNAPELEVPAPPEPVQEPLPFDEDE